MWSDWKPHAQGPCPVNPVALVRARMGNGDILSPMLAMDLDWNFPGDPVVQYQVKDTDEPARALEICEARHD